MRCEFGGGTGPGTEARIIALKIRRFALNNLPMTKGMKMKRPMAVFLAIVALAGPVRAEDKAELKDNRTKFSYAIGLNMGSQLKRQKIDPDINLILKGIKDGIGGHPQFTDQEVREVFTTFQQEHQKQMAEQNKQEGDKFLAENKSREGVKALEVTLPDGKKSELQYKVLAEGKGDSPKSNDVVTVNYRGTLIDGTEFDSSYKRNQPYTTPANHVVKGWTEALQRMKPGAKWQLVIPSELAYGERGSRQIGPNETLIFEMELISFTPPPKPTNAPPVAATPAQPVTSDIIKVPSKEELEKGAKIEVIKASDLEKYQKEQQEKEQKEKQQQTGKKVDKK